MPPQVNETTCLCKPAFTLKAVFSCVASICFHYEEACFSHSLCTPQGVFTRRITLFSQSFIGPGPKLPQRPFSEMPRHQQRLAIQRGGSLVSFRGDLALTALLIIVSWGLWPICKSTSACPCLPSLWVFVLWPALSAESGALGAADSWGGEVRWRNHVDSLRRGSFHPSEFHFSPHSFFI